jgi:hypothetical protein
VKLHIKETPRVFEIGVDRSIKISDMGNVWLQENEQLTFVTPTGAETDIVRKKWGFYATGSLNGRLPEHNLRPVLTENAQGRFYIMLVEVGAESEFLDYIRVEENRLVCWLDDETLKIIGTSFQGKV